MVKAFRYKLERLLKIRERFEQNARRLLGLATMELAHAQECLKSVRAAECRIGEEEGLLVADGKTSVLPLQQAMLASIQVQCLEAVEEVQVKEKRMEQAREVWRENRRQVRSLEVLREKKFEEWRGQVLREEAQEMDEIGRMRFCRERGEQQ